MKTKEILIIPKITKVEWDMHRLDINEKQLINFYKKTGLNVDKIFDSHKRQKESLGKIKSILKDAQIVERNDLTKESVKNSSLVIAFGGDNHFQYVSHFLDEIPILGINSDPARSEGALTSFTIKDLDKILPLILENRFEIEDWTRIEVNVNGNKIKEPAISEIFIGEEKRFNMSRHILSVNGKSEEQKGSGLLITTGVGSTGWYNSASRYLFPNGDAFAKRKKEARFILTEPYKGKLSPLTMTNGVVKEKEEVEIVSLSDSQAFLSIDSLKLIKLKEGAKIKINIGRPLKVIKLK